MRGGGGGLIKREIEIESEKQKGEARKLDCSYLKVGRIGEIKRAPHGFCLTKKGRIEENGKEKGKSKEEVRSIMRMRTRGDKCLIP